MRGLKETFEILEQDLLDTSQSRNFKEVYEKLNERLDNDTLSNEHAELQLICAKELIKQGYDVDVEHPLDDGFDRRLVCDIRSTYSSGTTTSSSLIVEAEIGYYFNPDRLIVDLKKLKDYKIDRSLTRIVSKISRYSGHADHFAILVYDKESFPDHFDKFGIGKPEKDSLLAMYGNMGSQLCIPSLMLEPYKTRDSHDIKLLKTKADELYARPKVSEEDIRHGRIDFVYVVDTKNLRIDRYDLRKPEPCKQCRV